MVQNGPESLDWCRWSKTFQNSPGWFKTVQHGSEYFRTVESRMIISDGSMTVETEWSRTVFYLVQNKAMFKLCSLCWATKVVFLKLFGWILDVPYRVHHELAHLSHFTHSFAFFRSTYWVRNQRVIRNLGKLFELVENTWSKQKSFIISIQIIDGC